MIKLKPYFAMRSVEALWAHHTDQMAEFGFDRLIYAYTAFRNFKTFGDPNDALVLTNHDPRYIEEYVGKGLFRNGPMMKWAAQSTGVASWKDMMSRRSPSEMSDGERQVIALNERFGLVAGYTISFPMAMKHASAGIGLAARPGLSQADVEKIWARDGDEIEVMNTVAHLCILQLPAMGQNRVMTKRQTQVLELVADGKTLQDIALLLQRNVATVEKHLRGAREALGVETTAQAVRKASILNQIFVLDPTRDESATPPALVTSELPAV